MNAPPLKKDVTGILLDVEGTTTPISFVYDRLFPYARARVESFLAGHLDDPRVRAELRLLREAHGADERQAENRPPPPGWADERLLESAVAYVHWLMDADRKLGPLKAIQGLIWEQGYRTGELRGEVFPDVPAAFERWHRQNRDVRIYSSGSVLAQRLIFAFTEAGDLTRFIRGYFDTQVGPKTQAQSYRHITQEFGKSSEEVVFISDSTAELDAARTAGMQTLLSLRPGNSPPAPAAAHPTIRSFDELF